LQQREIIVNKRGIGYFVDAQGMSKVIEFKKEQFLANELPVFFKSMYLLDMSIEEIDKQYRNFIKENFTRSNDEN
jgi:DNA-binding transcriptional regulator YhcF (GntR family)